MKSPIYPILALVLITAACGRSSSPAKQSVHAESSSKDGLPQVVVSPNQLKMLKVGRAVSYRFHPETDVIGTVSFDEDPAVLQAEATFLTAAATRRQMEKEVIRAAQLHSTNSVSEKELDQAKSDAATARSNYLAARSAALALGKTDQQLNVLESTGKLPVMIQKTTKWVSLNVTEADSRLFRTGMRVRIATLALPGHVFGGHIANIYGTVDASSHRLTVRASVADPLNQLKPGMLVTGTVATAPEFDAVAVPQTAIVREGDGTLTAWTTTDGHHFSQRTLQTGLEQDHQTQIIRGLNAGERVVVNGGIYLDNMLQTPSGD